MTTEKLSDGSIFCLSMGDNLKVTIEELEYKQKRITIQQLSLDIIKQLQTVLELSKKKKKYTKKQNSS